MDKWVVDIGTGAVFGIFHTQGAAIEWASRTYPAGGWKVLHFFKVN
jgi:hypothetical protein